VRGHHSYVSDTQPAELLQALHVVMRGDALLSPAVTRRLISEFVARPPDAVAAAGMETLTNSSRRLLPRAGGRQVTPRTPAEVLELAAALKRENPSRTAAQVARVLRASGGWSPSERTLQRHFTRLELDTRPDGSPPPVFSRFEAARCNEMWTGDALHGPVIGGRKTYLFAFIDDHSG
jgi:hypothetical protein